MEDHGSNGDKRSWFARFVLSSDLAELLTDEQQVVLDHPIRRELLRRLRHADEPLSASRLAAQLPNTERGTIRLLAYHFSKLLKARMIELAGVRPVRGAQEHFYRLVVPRESAIITVLAATAEGDKRVFECVPESCR